MRVLIAFLLLLNLVLYLWVRMAPSEQQDERVASPDVGSLRLWSEVTASNSDLEAAASQPLPTAGVNSPTGVASGIADKPEAEDRPPQAAEGASTLIAPAAETESVEAPVDVESYDIPWIDGAESEEQGIEPSDVVAGVLETAQEPGTPVVAQAPDSQLVCGQLRWYDERETANAMVARLNEFNVRAELVNDPLEQRTGYWVLIPQQSNRAAALAKQTELRAKGVEDLWMFRKGPLLNSISVGLFTGRRRAERRAEEIRALGFEVEVRPRLKITERFAIAYRTDQRNAELLSEAVAREALLENQRAPCPLL